MLSSHSIPRYLSKGQENLSKGREQDGGITKGHKKTFEGDGYIC